MLLCVAPPLAGAVYKFLSPEQIREINQQMTRLVYLEDSQKIEIIAKHMGIQLTPELEGRQDLLSVMVAALEAYIRTDPERAAHSFELLLDNWPRPGTVPIQDTTAQREIVGVGEVAVLFMSLPPEISRKLFYELGLENVQRITLVITQLPSVSQSTRARVIRKFLEIEESRPSLEALCSILSSVVGASPKKAALRIKRLWPELDS